MAGNRSTVADGLLRTGGRIAGILLSRPGTGDGKAQRLVATVQSMCEVLIKALLPLAALIGILFLGALPFTGVARIWETGHTAMLMMSLAIVLLFFFNSVLSENPEHPPYPSWMHGLVIFGVFLLPLNSLLAAWALGLRIEQYGLTVDRLWAATIQLLIAGFTLSYAALILLRRTSALGAIQSANKVLAYVVAGVLILVNTPSPTCGPGLPKARPTGC